MNQAELNTILSNHASWLESKGNKGEQANFSNEYLNSKYSNTENIATISINEFGGVSYAAGRSTYVESGELSGTLIQCANLDFSASNLNGATIKGAIFYNCKFHNTHINNSEINQAVFVKSNLYLAYFFGIKELTNSTFIDCELANIFIQEANLSGSNLSRSTFKNCSFYNSDLSNSELQGSTFNNCDLSHVLLTKANAESTTFESCSMENTDLFNTVLNKSTLIDLDINKLKFTPVKNSVFKKAIHLHHGMRIKDVYV